MASSNPSIKAVDIPTEVPPRDTFQITVTARQGRGGDPIMSSGACPTKTGDPTGWVTPVTLWVDGERQGTEKLCLANDNEREAIFSLSLSPGEHTVEVRIHQVGDAIPLFQTWEQNIESSTYDDVRQTVTTDENARDPSRKTPAESLMGYVESIAKSLGASTTMLAAGAIGAIVLLGVL
ncbi:hypothetical protein C475_17843 [Halosimplex carlsbadense 2-9-1]|uniref:Uncharacterized protein n=1 Tax=Halosimplex carlsbadense 2-9-1 TaxID=797114 RepID=M0CKJ7_9EURY|nr:hypothetical protein [Halosimplex carlsbadense]ELZ22399.1 hypothetical protein C475_17843 [Halosimplex carlsbadense 2-9-1]